MKDFFFSLKKTRIVMFLLCLLISIPVTSSSHANDIAQIDRSFIMRNEGLILYPYNDIAGYQTICYGHKTVPSDIIKKEYTIPECMAIFEKDLTLVVIENNECLEQKLNNNQYTAVIDLEFNIGSESYCRSTLNRNLNNHESIMRIDNDFLMWRYITENGKLEVSDGIYDRRKREVDLYNTPE